MLEITFQREKLRKSFIFNVSRQNLFRNVDLIQVMFNQVVQVKFLLAVLTFKFDY